MTALEDNSDGVAVSWERAGAPDRVRASPLGPGPVGFTLLMPILMLFI